MVACSDVSFLVSIFIELARKDLVTGRIWFECLWVCLFWLLYLGENISECMADKYASLLSL
jgi:hypothetical protein